MHNILHHKVQTCFKSCNGYICHSKHVAERLTQLIEKEECTVPFIARYRKEQTNGMEAEKLREFLEALKEIRLVNQQYRSSSLCGRRVFKSCS